MDEDHLDNLETIILKNDNGFSDDLSKLKEATKIREQEYSKNFAQDFKEFLSENLSIYNDLELKCSDGSVFSMRALLACRSDYFKALFAFDSGKSWEEKRTVDLSQFESKLIQVVVESLFHFDINAIESVDIFKLLDVAIYLQMPSLIKIASGRVAEVLNLENLMEIFKTSQDTSNELLTDACKAFMSRNFDELAKDGKILEFGGPELILEVVKISKNFLKSELREIVNFVKAFFKIMTKLDKLDEFEKLVDEKFYRDHLYFAMTHDRNSLLFFKHEINFQIELDLDDSCRITPDSDLGKFLTPLCLKPMDNKLFLRGIKAKWWTPMHRESTEWSIEGDIKKIQFFKTILFHKVYISGLQITLTDDSIHSFGQQDPRHASEEFDGTNREIHRIAIKLDENHLIEAIQVNHYDPNHSAPETQLTNDIFPRNFDTADFKKEMAMFGPHLQSLNPTNPLLFKKKYRVGGLSGKTVQIGGIPFICELSVKYCLDLNEVWICDRYFDEKGNIAMTKIDKELEESVPLALDYLIEEMSKGVHNQYFLFQTSLLDQCINVFNDHGIGVYGFGMLLM